MFVCKLVNSCIYLLFIAPYEAAVMLVLVAMFYCFNTCVLNVTDALEIP